MPQDISYEIEDMAFPSEIGITLADSPAADAFGRLRISDAVTLFDGKTLTDAAPLKYDDQQTSGSGTASAFNANQSSVTISVGNLTAGTRVRQSFQRFNYIPGKSQFILCTFVMGALAAGIQKAIGYFDDRSGIFFRANGTTLEIVRRTYTSGSVVDNAVAQSSWNLDKLDGTGASGITLDMSKTQIFLVDLEWLGVGRVRAGFNIDGVTIYCHEFLNANNLTLVYMDNPVLPVRYSIANSGTGPAASLTCICATVISEGGRHPIGNTFGVANSAIRSGINGSGATRYAMLGMRLKAANVRFSTVIPTAFTIMGTTASDAFAWELILNPTVAGSPTWVGITNSAVEWVDGSSTNTVTAGTGTTLASGVAFSESANFIVPEQDIFSLSANIAGTPQELYFIIRPFSNMSAVAGVAWREVS